MAVVTEEFVVDHVRARRISSDDLEDLCSMHADAMVMATLGGVPDQMATQHYLEINIEHWEHYGFGIYVLRDLDCGALVGRAGLRHVEIGGGDEIEVAYALCAEFWGRGLAAMVTEELVRIAAKERLCTDLVGFTLTTNRRSWRVMGKAGFVYEREVEHSGMPHVLYRRRLRGE